MTSYRSFVSLTVTKMVFEIYVTFQWCPVGRVTRLGDFSSIVLLLEANLVTLPMGKHETNFFILGGKTRSREFGGSRLHRSPQQGLTGASCRFGFKEVYNRPFYCKHKIKTYNHSATSKPVQYLPDKTFFSLFTK
jgi:hypothetical protein